MERVYPLAKSAKQHLAFHITRSLKRMDVEMDFLELDSFDKKRCLIEMLVRLYFDGHFYNGWPEYLKISYSDVQDVVDDVLSRLNIRP